MAACLSPVNLSAPMSAFFLKPISARAGYTPFPRDFAAVASVVTRQPRGPPETNALSARKAAPAPVKVPAPATSWRDRANAGPAEMPPKSSSRASASPKSAGRRKGRRSGAVSPRSASTARSTSPEPASPEPVVEVAATPISAAFAGEKPAARVYDITFLLCLSASPLNGVTEAERTHMEDLVYNHTWRRGPHQSVSRPSSRASSRASSPARSTSSRASSPAPVERVQNLRRDGKQRRASSKLRTATSDESQSD